MIKIRPTIFDRLFKFIWINKMKKYLIHDQKTVLKTGHYGNRYPYFIYCNQWIPTKWRDKALKKSGGKL